MGRMIDFRFAQPLVFVALIPALIGLYFWMRRERRAPPVLRYSDTRLLRGLPVGWRVRLRRLPDVLRLAGAGVLLIVVARPQTGVALTTIRGQGVDIVIALDVSDSMSTGDFPPYSRLEAARIVLDAFIAERPNDRIGLVTFAEDAVYEAPPTLDTNLVRRILMQVNLASASGRGNRTALGIGLAAAASLLKDSSAPSKVIILITDGANNAGLVDPQTAADAAHALGIRVYTIGIGQAGGDLDEAALRQIAVLADGQYFSAAQMSDLQTITDQIDQLERSPSERNLRVRWQDQAEGWLLFALVLLITERLLRLTIFQTIP
jgi:Ca-activated chloride channel homolog